MKFQQQQKEMTMKPWEREIQELERFFIKTLEAENQKANTSMSVNNSSMNMSAIQPDGTYDASLDQGKVVQETNKQTLYLIQHLKERNKKEVLARYFNYNFDEASFKTYINQNVQKFYDQSRITQALQQNPDEQSKHKPQSIIYYQQYLEQQAQRQVYK